MFEATDLPPCFDIPNMYWGYQGVRQMKFEYNNIRVIGEKLEM